MDCPTVLIMAPLIAILAATIAVATLLAALIRRGFRDGDIDTDVEVSACALDPGRAGPATGAWVEVIVENPSAGTALAALRLRRARRVPWAAPAVGRRTAAGRRARLSLADQSIGPVPPGDVARFWLWTDHDPRRVDLLAAVGTEGRLRLHRIPVSAAAPPAGRPGIADRRPTLTT